VTQISGWFPLQFLRGSLWPPASSYNPHSPPCHLMAPMTPMAPCGKERGEGTLNTTICILAFTCLLPTKPTEIARDAKLSTKLHLGSLVTTVVLGGGLHCTEYFVFQYTRILVFSNDQISKMMNFDIGLLLSFFGIWNFDEL
jgi:hypothetical protein